MARLPENLLAPENLRGTGKLHSELAAMERRWARHRRICAVGIPCLWAVFALIVFAGAAFETGKVARQLPGAFPSVGAGGANVVPDGGVQASHTAGPSVVADQLHSKMEGKCR